MQGGDEVEGVRGFAESRTSRREVHGPRLVGVCVREVARIVLDAMPDDAAHETARMQLEHMVKTRDGGETIRIVKTLAVKGRF